MELVAEQNGFGPLGWVMEALLTRDTGEIAARFGALFRCITAAAEKYLDEMAQELGDTPEDPARRIAGLRSGGGITIICRSPAI